MDESTREGWLVMVKWKGGEYALRTIMFAATAEEAIQYEKSQGWCVHGWDWTAIRVAVLANGLLSGGVLASKESPEFGTPRKNAAKA